jgi:hypothetical protein
MQKNICLEAAKAVVMEAAELLLVRWISWYYGTNLTYNGLAV